MPRRKSTTLTARQRAIFEYLREQIVGRGYGPTIREIGTHFGITNPNGVVCHLKALERKGLIARTARRSRAIQLVDPPGQRMRLGVKGTVVGGVAEVDWNAAESADFSDLFDAIDQFCLKVTDDSLLELDIADGDHLLCRRPAEPRDGRLVLADPPGVESPGLFRVYEDRLGLRLEAVDGSGTTVPATTDDLIAAVIGVIRRM